MKNLDLSLYFDKIDGNETNAHRISVLEEFIDASNRLFWAKSKMTHLFEILARYYAYMYCTLYYTHVCITLSFLFLLLSILVYDVCMFRFYLGARFEPGCLDTNNQ